jgi:Domain of unknown function (DUF4365)
MQQERFADAFLTSTAARAGCAAVRPDVDDDSVDWTLSCRLAPRRPKLDVQMKSTTTAHARGGVIRYSLKRKNYDDLILTELTAPRILILVLLPADIARWMNLTVNRLVLRRCAYWLSLRGDPETENDAYVTVHVPTANLFDDRSLTDMMIRINNGGFP